MTRSEAEQRIEAVKRVLRDFSDKNLPQEKAATLGSRAHSAPRDLNEVIRLLKCCPLRLDQIDTDSRVIHIPRLNGSLSTSQPYGRQSYAQSPHG